MFNACFNFGASVFYFRLQVASTGAYCRIYPQRNFQEMKKGCTHSSKVWLLSIGFVLMLAGQSFAQEQKKINSGRPDQTHNTYTVAPGMLQLETGLKWQHDRQAGAKVRHHAYPEITLRTGVLSWLELRAETYWQDTVRENGSRQVAHGIGPVKAGALMRFWKANGLFPAAALLTTVTLPVGSQDLRPKHTETELTLALSHELSKKLQLAYNVRYGWLEANPEQSYAINLLAQLSDKFSMFGEVYGSKPKGEKAMHQGSVGLLFLLKPNMQFDVAAGVGLNKEAPDYFMLTGFSVRLPK